MDFLWTIKRLLRKPLSPFEAYQRWASSYDEGMNLLFHLDAALMRPYFDGRLFCGKDILDFGCGTGRYWPDLLLQNPASLTGIDLSPAMLAKLKAKIPGASAYVIDKHHETRAAGAGRYDIIICNLVIDYVPDTPSLFRRWNEWLRAGGTVIVTDLYPHSAQRGARTFSWNQHIFEIEHQRNPIDKVKAMLEQAGLHLVKAMEQYPDDDSEEFFKDKESFLRWRAVPFVYGLQLMKGQRASTPYPE